MPRMFAAETARALGGLTFLRREARPALPLLRFVDAQHPSFDARALHDGAGHLTFSALQRLPFAESRANTYDVMPLLRRVIEQRVSISPTVQFVFLSGREVVRADVGSSCIAFSPYGFTRGGVFTFDTRF